MMITSFTVHVDEKTGKATVSAPDFSKDGHTWAIDHEPINPARLREAARALGVEHLLIAGQREILRRQQLVADSLEQRVIAAQEAQQVVDRLREELNQN